MKKRRKEEESKNNNYHLPLELRFSRGLQWLDIFIGPSGPLKSYWGTVGDGKIALPLEPAGERERGGG